MLLLAFISLVLAATSQSQRPPTKTQSPSDALLIQVARQINASRLQSAYEKILVPRVPGSNGHAQVRKYLTSTFQHLGWHISSDTFSESTPHGQKEFHNIIATLNPSAPRKLVLAAHYDSKVLDGGEFLAATDSAGPCAILVEVASMLTQQLKQCTVCQVSVQIIFFDGEEAFHEWSADDSLYGARHLAEQWAGLRPPKVTFNATSILETIDLFVLLDLLGSADPWPAIHDNELASTEWFHALVDIEMCLSTHRLLSLLRRKKSSYFIPRDKDNVLLTYGPFMIDDDHRPFRDMGVPIVHVIPLPFPKVWHTLQDNSVELPILEDFAKIMAGFVLAYDHEMNKVI